MYIGADKAANIRDLIWDEKFSIVSNMQTNRVRQPVEL